MKQSWHWTQHKLDGKWSPATMQYLSDGEVSELRAEGYSVERSHDDPCEYDPMSDF